MDRPGAKLRRLRENLKLTYREVVEASRQIAEWRGSPEFKISLAGLADIENADQVPSIFRLYTLCAVYRQDLQEVLRWYGVPLEMLAADALQIHHKETHALQFDAESYTPIPPPRDARIDLNQTAFLKSPMRQWSTVPLNLISGIDRQRYRYGLIGFEDRSMSPILRPGSLVLIDENRRRIARGGWRSEFDRPIYFLEYREGYTCGWCTLDNGRLMVHPHPASEKTPQVFRFPHDIEVVGQVVGVAMLLESGSTGQSSGLIGTRQVRKAAAESSLTVLPRTPD